ncbi:periplasmic nitrate reductase, NapE protein [Microbulbifer bruguierae]|uniref:Periplasmic nitrate reductase, NapE protein n=1 Tax=Microbulbifer bruguierae TaxID=3029061 RepID=A0ABY8NCG3_9GAMM|nr:periplasmic nitrate reductase, NapE protein [Microbulbifer bruguierae]WGL15757.1 periplasmic nitrate reductase, NapE protein [Microbulbifer bruguierae]
MTEQRPVATSEQRRRERRLVLFILIFLFPILAVAIVGGYGFLVWILQMIFGPPGPPA